jgi:hypothetical protein
MYSDDEYEDNGSDLVDFVANDNEDIEYETNDEEFEEEEFDENNFEEYPDYDDANYGYEDEDETNDEEIEDEDKDNVVLLSHNPITSIDIHDLPSTQPWDTFNSIPVNAFMTDSYRRQYNPNFGEKDEEEDYEGHGNLS